MADITAYATVEDVQARMTRTLSAEEQAVCETLLQDVAVLIDSYNSAASEDAKLVVSCRVVSRALGDGGTIGIPMGATQGSMSAMGYSQSWTLGSNASVGEVYFGKVEKKLLGVGEHVGSYSPTQELVGTPL